MGIEPKRYEINIAIGNFLTRDMLIGKNRIIAYGKDAINKLQEFGIKPLAEIPDDMDDIEKLLVVKSIFEDASKKGINIKDKLKSKIAILGNKIKGGS